MQDHTQMGGAQLNDEILERSYGIYRLFSGKVKDIKEKTEKEVEGEIKNGHGDIDTTTTKIIKFKIANQNFIYYAETQREFLLENGDLLSVIAEKNKAKAIFMCLCLKIIAKTISTRTTPYSHETSVCWYMGLIVIIL